LLFLILHLKHFWAASRLEGEINAEHTMFHELQEIFANPLVVLVYVLGCISLAYHLLHGFQSAFQTLGWNHPKYTPTVQLIGKIYAILISLVFASMPIAFHFNLIK